ncbi:hypothetical protein [Bifidobacterium bifidum]|uniref:hypothetical protein n=1 Tax=Bifidobacterium bifidum TaxID=1681 RepID=UPI003CFFC416
MITNVIFSARPHAARTARIITAVKLEVPLNEISERCVRLGSGFLVKCLRNYQYPIYIGGIYHVRGRTGEVKRALTFLADYYRMRTKQKAKQCRVASPKMTQVREDTELEWLSRSLRDLSDGQLLSAYALQLGVAFFQVARQYPRFDLRQCVFWCLFHQQSNRAYFRFPEDPPLPPDAVN